MAQEAPARTKIHTKSPQPARGRPRGARPGGPGRAARRRILAERDGARGHPGRPPGDRAGVRDHGVPGPRGAGPLAGGLARERRSGSQCEAATEAKLAAKLEKVTERLASRRAEHGAARRGPDRVLPVRRTGSRSERQWSRKHAHTQRRLCERFAAPVIGAVTLPGHHDRAHAADRQRRAHAGGGRPGPGHDLGPGQPRASRAGTWPTRGWPRCTGRPGTARCPPRG